MSQIQGVYFWTWSKTSRYYFQAILGLQTKRNTWQTDEKSTTKNKNYTNTYHIDK